MPSFRQAVWAVLLVVAFLVVVRPGPIPKPLYDLAADEPPPAVPSRHDPAACGSVAGRVAWDGPRPVVPPFDVTPWQAQPDGLPPQPNPLAPRIAADGGVGGAIVFLRGVDPAAARPWDHPTPSIVLENRAIKVRQDGDHAAGWCRVGEAVEVATREPGFDLLRGRGANFFAMPLPAGDVARKRSMPRPGLVELSSGAGYYWSRGWLWVAEHPYFTRTVADGSFRLDGVPEGNCEVVCWLPNSRIRKTEHDPEISVTFRLAYQPPVEKAAEIAVGRGRTASASFRLDATAFGR